MSLLAEINSIVLISRWLHVLAAITAIGGAVFMRFALLPAAKKTLDEATHEQLKEAVRARWAPFVHGSITVLLLTGMVNFYFLVLAKDVKPMPYHVIFGVKFLAAMFVFFVGTALVGRSAGFESIRSARAKWLTALLVTAALIVLISGILSQLRG